MKTKYFIVAIIILAFLSVGCTVQENYDFKVKVIPESKSSVITLNDMNRASEIISKRLNNSFGYTQENMKTDVTEDQISLTIFKADTSKIASVKKIITGYARLEFWETFENNEIIGSLKKANNLLKEMKVVPEVKNGNKQEEFIAQNPLFGILRPMINADGEPMSSSLIGLASETDTAKVDRYLQMPQVKALFPGNIKFMWSHTPIESGPSKGQYELHAIKVTRLDGKAPLDGSVIVSASLVKGSSDADNKIDLTMDAEGTQTWARITRENIKRCIAIVLDGSVRSYPKIQVEISGGKTEITGSFTQEEASDLVNIFKSGELPFELKIADEQIIKMK